jgi:hypothetical protein
VAQVTILWVAISVKKKLSNKFLPLNYGRSFIKKLQNRTYVTITNNVYPWI